MSTHRAPHVAGPETLETASAAAEPTLPSDAAATSPTDAPTLTGKTVLVTGGTSGIGFITARELARGGARVSIVGRDRGRGRMALDALRAEAGADAPVDFHSVDLSDQQAVREFAGTFLARTPRLDVLVNNAGGMFGLRQLSADGIEMTFALNHLSYFLLSHLLLPALQAAAPARIVNVASEAHRGVELDFDDLQGEMHYRRWTAYRRSKLANIMFTYVLARQLAGSGVTVNALHPGFVATEIGTRHRFVPHLAWKIGTLFAIGPEKGARTPLHLATAPALADTTGGYFINCRPARSSAQSYDEGAQQRLWDISVNLTGVVC